MAKSRPPVFLLAIFFLLVHLALGQRAIIELPLEVETSFPYASENQTEEKISSNSGTDPESISSKSDNSPGENADFPTKKDFNQTSGEVGSAFEGVQADEDPSGAANESSTTTLEQNSTATDSSNLTTEISLLNDTFLEYESHNDSFYLNDTDYDTNETIVTEPSVPEVDEEAEELVEEVEEDLTPQSGMYLEDYCSCDLTTTSCDIGCCCDQDCSPDDTRAFATCTTAPRTLTADPRYCSQRWTGLRHNTEYRLEETQAGLLCIQADNRPLRNTFRPLKIVRTRQQFDELKDSLPPPPTTARAPAERDPARDPAHYHQGDKLWAITSGGRFIQLGLPSSLLGRECDTVRPFSYLNNAKTSCSRRLQRCSTSSELGPRHYANFLVVTKPATALRLLPNAVDPESQESTTPESAEDLDETTITKPTPSTTTTTFSVTETYSENSTIADLTMITDFNETNSDVSQNNSMSQNETNLVRNNSSDIPNILSNLESLPNYALLKEKYFLLNSSYLVEVQIELCREVEEALECQEDVDVNELPEDTGCGEVVSRVDYVITHNGTEGIKSVVVKILLASSDRRNSEQTSFGGDSLGSSGTERCDCDSEEVYDEENFWDDETSDSFVTQVFSVEYQWLRDESEDASEDEVIHRSGRPGYIKGKPLLLGSLVKNTTHEGEILEAISTDSDPMLGLTMLRGGAGGLCQDRTPVTFGDNMRSVCSLMASEEEASVGCDQLRERIIEELLGPVLGDEEALLRVASYGDSSLVHPVEWVPLLRTKESLSESYDDDLEQFSEEGRCSNLVLSIRLEVAFALQGSLVHPQAKVIGCLLITGPPQLGPPTGCYGPLCKQTTPEDPNRPTDSIEEDTILNNVLNNTVLPDQASTKKSVTVELTSTVVFIDMTLPSEPVFPDPPSLDLKLPYDFFYPYLPSRAAKSWHVNSHLWLMFTCFVYCLHRVAAP